MLAVVCISDNSIRYFTKISWYWYR